MPTESVLHWFRKDLRLSDNLALNAAILLARKTNSPLVPLYVLDHGLNPGNCGAVRMRFLLQSVRALQSSLQEHGMQLRVVNGNATDVIPELARRWRVKNVFWEREYAPERRRRDELVLSALRVLNIEVKTFPGFLLYDPDVILRYCNGSAPRNMSGMLKLVDEIGDPDIPEAFANSETVQLADDIFLAGDKKDDMFRIPSLKDLGYPDSTDDWEVFEGGESAGLKRLNAFMTKNNGRAVAEFSKPKTNPAAIFPRETTVLSPYLALGCISCRLFYSRLREIEERYTLQDMRQTTLRGQLLWREHFWLLAFSIDNFHQMRGNIICRQIRWRGDKQSTELLQRWASAQTGYPWIDALMTQLHKEGFVHHLGRHSLACFLTRGDLWVSWEQGFKVFEKHLIDYDYALNSANWMWLSCSAFFVMYYRVYSPVAFGKKWDKHGKFVRHYLPVLQKMPSAYIYEPWKAPRDVQKKAGCIIGKHYPKPIVDHSVVSKVNIERMKKSYAKSEFGTPSQQSDGDVSTTFNARTNTGKSQSDEDFPGRKRRRL